MWKVPILLSFTPTHKGKKQRGEGVPPRSVQVQSSTHPGWGRIPPHTTEKHKMYHINLILLYTVRAPVESIKTSNQNLRKLQRDKVWVFFSVYFYQY
jgi:hypothetical protein